MKSLIERRSQVSTFTRQLTPDYFHNLFFEKANQYAKNDYIYSQGTSLTYTETSNLVKRLAYALYQHGYQEEQKNVALIFPNYAEFVISKLATSVIKQVAVPLNYKLNKEEMRYLIHQSDSISIITIDCWRNSNYIEMLHEICPEVFEGKVSKVFPKLKEIIVFSPQGHKYPGTIDFYDFIDSVELEKAEAFVQRKLAQQTVNVLELSDIMYTSGTTSQPKGVLVNHDMVWRVALGSCINRGYQEGRRIYIPIPLYHCFGYVIGLIAATMVGGAVILQADFNEYEALSLIREFKVDDMLCVPTIAIRLIDAYKAQSEPFNLHSMYCAGAEVPITLWQELKNTLNIKELITGYGMTELASGVLQSDPQAELDYLIQYVGKTIPGGHVGISELNGNCIEFKVRDLYTREFLENGVEGELVCRGPIVTKGYYNKPKETAEAIEDGWLNTGDLAIIHDNGYISLTGRIKEIYRIGAENVAPKEVEEVITAYPQVSQAYVAGIPDPLLGEVGVAWVVIEKGATITTEELAEYLKHRLARFKIPKYIEFVTEQELPKTSTGKIQKFKLKELFLTEKRA